MRVAFVTNICPHYRVATFELLAQEYDIDYYFFSAGDDWYWQQQHGVRDGQFSYRYLPGVRIGHTRVTPTLPWRLLTGGYDLYVKCINGKFALPVTYAVSRLRGKPFVLWTGIWMQMHTRIHRLLFPFTRFIYRHADAIVVYGEHVKRYLISEGVRPERIFVAAHAVDNRLYQRQVPPSEQCRLREELGIRADERVVLYLGRIEQVKGLSYLLDAFANTAPSNAVLVLAGTGSALPGLQERAKQLGISERVRFPGYVKTDKTVTYYAIASVFVLPSITMPTFKEPWGLVVN
jgi:glycosyltransferase involved in cell wall biosynthesis